MKFSGFRVLSKILISILLILIALFATSCNFDPDEAVNIRGCVTEEIEVKEDSTVFRFYYSSDEQPIENYGIIRVRLEYYVDYNSLMKKKNFFLEVPDDVQFEDKTYFTVEIDDALTEESVVYIISVLANQKTESNSRAWIYVLTVIIAVALLIILWSVYMAMCDAYDSNTAMPSLMWLGGLILFGIITLVIAVNWGNGPGGIMIGGVALYFICSLFPYFKYKN